MPRAFQSRSPLSVSVNSHFCLEVINEALIMIHMVLDGTSETDGLFPSFPYADAKPNLSPCSLKSPGSAPSWCCWDTSHPRGGDEGREAMGSPHCLLDGGTVGALLELQLGLYTALLKPGQWPRNTDAPSPPEAAGLS